MYFLVDSYKKYGSPEQSSDGLKKPVRYQRPNRFSTTYFRTTKLINIRIRHNPDYYILGFREHEIFWIVRLLTARKYLIFDSLISP